MKRINSFLQSSFSICLIERLIRNPTVVGRSNDASRRFQHFLRRLFFSRIKFQNPQNIPNFYTHPLFFNRRVDLEHLRQLLNKEIYSVKFPEMQALKTFSMSPHVIKTIRNIFVMLSQSDEDFGLLMSCTKGYFIKMHFSPANGTDEFLLNLEIFHENQGMTFRVHEMHVKIHVNMTQDQIVEIQLHCKSNHRFQLFYIGTIRVPCFTTSARTIGWTNDFKIITVTFYGSMSALK